MVEKDFISLVDHAFKDSGDCYGEEKISRIIWDSLVPTDETDRENGCKVVASISPSGTGYVWLCIKDGKLYTNWETKCATTLIVDDGSEYYKELYLKVQKACPEIVFNTRFRMRRNFYDESSEVLVAIASEEERCTYFGIKNLNVWNICSVLQREIPAIEFKVLPHPLYPFGDCLMVGAAHCKLRLLDSGGITTVMLDVY